MWGQQVCIVSVISTGQSGQLTWFFGDCTFSYIQSYMYKWERPILAKAERPYFPLWCEPENVVDMFLELSGMRFQ